MSTQASKAAELVAALGAVDADGSMLIDHVPVAEIASTVGTPFFAYSGRCLIERIRTLKSALGDSVSLYFSIKSNPSVGVCQLIAAEGVGAELASCGELAVAKAAGFAPSAVIFAGPGKTTTELEEALLWGIGSINVESVGELRRISELALKHSRSVRVCLRVNPIEQLKGAQMRMGGGPSQFGIDEEAVEAIAEEWRDHPWMKIIGIHVYVGTQLFDVSAMLQHDRHVLELAERVARQLRHPLEMVDFGGGFAVPYFEGSVPFDLEAFAAGFSQITAEMRQNEWLRTARPVIELGRYMIAEAGLYVTRVVDLKKSRGTCYVVTDGGMNHHITATGNFGQVFRKAYPMAILNKLSVTAESIVNIVGPCCTPLDVLGQKVTLPSVDIGDFLGVFYSGAYGYSASSLSFLSHPTPAEVLVLGERQVVLRKGGSAAQVLEHQSILSNEVLELVSRLGS